MDSNPSSKMGRPEYIPNEKDALVVRALCLFGANHEWISSYIGITAKTLRKWYPDLLANCKADKNGSARASLFTQVIRGNMDAIKFWLEHNDSEYSKTKAPDDSNADALLKHIANKLTE